MARNSAFFLNRTLKSGQRFPENLRRDSPGRTGIKEERKDGTALCWPQAAALSDPIRGREGCPLIPDSPTRDQESRGQAEGKPEPGRPDSIHFTARFSPGQENRPQGETPWAISGPACACIPDLLRNGKISPPASVFKNPALVCSPAAGEGTGPSGWQVSKGRKRNPPVPDEPVPQLQCLFRHPCGTGGSTQRFRFRPNRPQTQSLSRGSVPRLQDPSVTSESCRRWSGQVWQECPPQECSPQPWLPSPCA